MTTDNDSTAENEPRATTAGEVDHSNPDDFRGGEVDPPRDPDEPISESPARYADADPAEQDGDDS